MRNVQFLPYFPRLWIVTVTLMVFMDYISIDTVSPFKLSSFDYRSLTSLHKHFQNSCFKLTSSFSTGKSLLTTPTELNKISAWYLVNIALVDSVLGCDKMRYLTNKCIVVSGGCAEKSGQLFAADELLSVNGTDVTSMTRIEAWGLMKRLADGKVVLSLRHKTVN